MLEFRQQLSERENKGVLEDPETHYYGHKKKYLKAGKLIFSLSLLAYLFSQVKLNILWTQLKELNIYVLVLAFGILLVQCTLSSFKWKIILTAEDRSVPFRFLLKSYLIGNFIGLFLPTSFGGDLYRIYTLKEYNKDYLQNTSSVLFDRISGLFALASISVISISFFYQDIIKYKYLILYFISICIFWILSSNYTIDRLKANNKKPFTQVTRILESFHKYRDNKRILFLCLLISFIFQSNIVILNKFYCHSLNIDIPISYLFMVIPIIYLTEAIPISINGLGVRESAFVFFFTQKGVMPEKALAVGLLVITIRYGFSILFGGSLFLGEMVRTSAVKKEDHKQNKLCSKIK